jgi:ABC-2 type transport system permease protein
MSAEMTAATARPATGRKSALRTLTRTEFVLFLRERAGPAWAIGFPVLLLIIFGAIPAFRKPLVPADPHLSVLDSYVPILLAFALAMISLNVVPPVLAGYREKGVLRRLATTPVGPVRVVAAQLIVDAALTAVSMIIVLLVARLGYGVAFPNQALGFLVAAVLGGIALLGLGLLLASVASTGRAANAVGAILFFPMMFFAGLWLPIAAMPKVLQHISHITPLGAAVQAMTDAWQGTFPHPLQLVALACYAGFCRSPRLDCSDGSELALPAPWRSGGRRRARRPPARQAGADRAARRAGWRGFAVHHAGRLLRADRGPAAQPPHAGRDADPFRGHRRLDALRLHAAPGLAREPAGDGPVHSGVAGHYRGAGVHRRLVRLLLLHRPGCCALPRCR